MTPQERLSALIAREPMDRKLIISTVAHPQADIVLADPERDQLRFASVDSVLTRLKKSGIQFGALNPEQLNQHVIEAYSRALEEATAANADGIWLVIDGAGPETCTPMEFGGHFLEVERELISNIKLPTIAFIAGDGELYLDAVSDLPCEILAWTLTPHHLIPSEMRLLRNEPIAVNSTDADALLVFDRVLLDLDEPSAMTA